MRSLLFFVVVALAPPMAAVPASGQVVESPEGALSRGAGAYFSGRSAEADKQLSQAIEFAPSDPRGHYLRGLNFVKLGDLAKARVDLAEGARLEAAGMNGIGMNGTGGHSSASIDRFLASVQGSSRAMLERIRREARRQVVVDQRAALIQAQRHARQESEKRVLRTTYQLPIETLISQLTPAQAQRVAIKTTAPIAAFIVETKSESVGETGSMVVPEAADAVAAETGDSDPFADDAPSDPFADEGSVAPPAASTTTTSPKPVDADIPEEARGS